MFPPVARLSSAGLWPRFWVGVTLAVLTAILPPIGAAADSDDGSGSGSGSESGNGSGGGATGTGDSGVASDVWISSLASLGDGNFIAGGAGGLLLTPADVMTFSASDPSKLAQRYKHESSVWAVAATADGGIAASVDYLGNLAVFDRAAGTAKIFKRAGRRWSRALAIDDATKTLIIGNEVGEIIRWSIADERVVGTDELVGAAITTIRRLSVDGEPVWIVGDSTGGIHAVDDQWTVQSSVVIEPGPAMAIAGHGDGYPGRRWRPNVALVVLGSAGR